MRRTRNKKLGRFRIPFIEPEDAELLRLKARGLSFRLIGNALGRSATTVRGRFLRLTQNSGGCHD